MLYGQNWTNDPWVWLPWLTVIGSAIAGVIAMIVIMVLTEPHDRSRNA